MNSGTYGEPEQQERERGTKREKSATNGAQVTKIATKIGKSVGKNSLFFSNTFLYHQTQQLRPTTFLFFWGGSSVPIHMKS